jgi:predicted nucleic acid-binding protein
MKTIVFNTSPLIFLARLDWLKDFVQPQENDYYLPQAVAVEIQAKTDRACFEIAELIRSDLLQVKNTKLISLANSLNQYLGRGESEAIALGIELQTDYLILDDAVARRKALYLGLNVKGTLAILKTMSHLTLKNGKESLYLQLLEANFRVKRKIFDEIFLD